MNKRKFKRGQKDKRRVVKNTEGIILDGSEPIILDQQTIISFIYHLRDTAGCGHYRAILPALQLNNMVDKMLKANAYYIDRCTPHPAFYKDVNFVIFQRGDNEQYFKVMKGIRAVTGLNTRLVYDIDDDLGSLPPYNYANDFFKKTWKYIENMMRVSDLVTVSTEPLREKYRKYNDNIICVPNRLSKFLFGDPVFNHTGNDTLKILYAGSDNHFAEKGKGGDFPEDLIRFILEGDNYDWNFIGGCPGELREGDLVTRHGWKSMLGLYDYIRSLDVDVYIAPLEKNEFNRSKSNIKALEAIALGIPIVATKWGPYEDIPYACNTTGEMLELLEELKNFGFRYKVWEEQCEYIGDDLFWEENDNTLKYCEQMLKAGFNIEMKRD